MEFVVLTFWFIVLEMKERIYLDHAASTPVDQRVFDAMKPYFSDKFGNAGSVHSYGQEAMAAIGRARETVAGAIGAGFNEIIFTSSATEANNLALRSVVVKAKAQLPKPRIIMSAIEHESILETAEDLEQWGVEVIYIPVNKNGFVDLKKFEKAINTETVLVSIMYANNEVGTIQPIKEVAKLIRKYKERNGPNKTIGPLLHTDAVQAFNYLDCNVNELHIDMMTLSSHKIYGPKGAGCLYVRNLEDLKLKPFLTGGGQEFGLRSSTENVPAIVGFAKAIELAIDVRTRESKRLEDLRNYFWKEMKKIYRKSELNGDINNRLPNNLNVYFPGIKAEELLIKMDLNCIAASSGSACASRSLEPSYVIQALGYKRERAEASIRLTLGRDTNKTLVDKTLKSFKILLNK